MMMFHDEIVSLTDDEDNTTTTSKLPHTLESLSAKSETEVVVDQPENLGVGRINAPFFETENELIFPELRPLFAAYNKDLFWGQLDSVEVRWSPRMTLSAGLCTYQKGGYCSVRLSEPLLKYRSVKEYRETLLHEMIHAYLFVTANNRDREAHGMEFKRHMFRLNRATGLNITIFHNFTDEVDHYRTHIWKCNGSCSLSPPYYGIVKRSMNRPPGPNDWWYASHKASCGGDFVKIATPIKVKMNKKKASEDSTGLNLRGHTSRTKRRSSDISMNKNTLPESRDKKIQKGSVASTTSILPMLNSKSSTAQSSS